MIPLYLPDVTLWVPVWWLPGRSSRDVVHLWQGVDWRARGANDAG